MKVAPAPNPKKFIGKRMEGGYLSRIEPELRRALRGPLKKYRRGHFAGLALRRGLKDPGR